MLFEVSGVVVFEIGDALNDLLFEESLELPGRVDRTVPVRISVPASDKSITFSFADLQANGYQIFFNAQLATF